MENNQTFQYTYSAEQQEEIRRIREKYVAKEEDAMTRLRRLDAAVSNKATAWAIAVGVVSTLIMGFGMSVLMTELFAALHVGIKIAAGFSCGFLGMAGVSCAYPLYTRILKKEREKIAPEILRLTDELTK